MASAEVARELSGAATAAGAVAGEQPLPSSFAVTSRSSNDQRTVRMGLSGGSVAALEIAPPLDEKPDRVPLKEAHKRSVVDPVSALLMPGAAKGDLIDPANCNRTLPIFDGAARFDVVDLRTWAAAGHRVDVLVSNATLQWVPGHLDLLADLVASVVPGGWLVR